MSALLVESQLHRMETRVDNFRSNSHWDRYARRRTLMKRN
jgi:hypothetical protein